jgi:hypothetical protein
MTKVLVDKIALAALIKTAQSTMCCDCPAISSCSGTGIQGATCRRNIRAALKIEEVKEGR